MKQNRLRAFLRLKRNLISSLGYKPGRSVSLVRAEVPCDVSYEVITNYDKSFAIDIYDQRSEKILGHYFQERNAYLLKNVILEPKNGLMFNLNGQLIEESTNWPIFQMYNSFPWNPKRISQKLDLHSAIFLSSSAFGHWLMEDLPLTIFAMNLDPNAPIIVASNPPKYVKDFLKLAGREVLYLDGPVQVSSLLIIQKNQDSGWPHPKDLATLNSFKPLASTETSKSPFRKVYASRRGARRSPGNEELIESLFIEHGYEVHNLEKFDLKAEVHLMKETLILAGVHGSAHVNNIWMPSGGTLVDIVNENYWTEAGHRLAFLSGSRYKFLKYKGSYNASVNLDELTEMIKSLESD